MKAAGGGSAASGGSSGLRQLAAFCLAALVGSFVGASLLSYAFFSYATLSPRGGAGGGATS